jgi:hypothetical protein
MRRLAWEALQQGTHAGIFALPLHLMAERRPFSRFSTSPGSIYFLQAQVPKGKIFDLGVVIHPGDEPSGAVPSVAASDHDPRSSRRGGEEGPDCFLFYLSRILFVISMDSCAIITKAKVLFVIVPTD